MGEIETLIYRLVGPEPGEIVLAVGLSVIMLIFLVGILWLEWRDR